MSTAGHHAADLQLGNTGSFDLFSVEHIHHLVLGHNEFAGLGIHHVMQSITANQTLGEAFDGSVAFADFADEDTLGSVAVFLADDDFLRNVNQTAGQVARVSGTQCGIGQTFTSASRRDEVRTSYRWGCAGGGSSGW